MYIPVNQDSDSEPSSSSSAQPSTSTTVPTGDSPEPTPSTTSQTSTVEKIGADAEPVPSTNSQVSSAKPRAKPMNTANPQGKSEYIYSKISIKLDKLTMGPTERVKVMTEMLENLPKSKYILHELDDTLDSNVSDVDIQDLEEVSNISSDETEAYWPLDDKQCEMKIVKPMKQ